MVRINESVRPRFLRCSPFDEFKLWKAQVDNGSKRGRERLNILTRTLLLRRTKDQLDSTGKPLVESSYIILNKAVMGAVYMFYLSRYADCSDTFQVSLPDRTCEVHQLKLSEDEQAVYDVVFAQSRLLKVVLFHLTQDLWKTFYLKHF